MLLKFSAIVTTEPVRKPCTKYTFSLASFSLHCYVLFQVTSENAEKHEAKKRYTFPSYLYRLLTFYSCLQGRSGGDRELLSHVHVLKLPCL